MKQVLQNLANGETVLADVPCPLVTAGSVLIQTRRSLVSAGTERMLVDFGRANLVQKARQQPEKVRQVLEKARTDGVLPTLDAVRNKLSQPLALGYSSVGVVAAVGEGVAGFAPGDRVASNGGHAQMTAVPANLCARVPDAVSDEQAAFVVVGAIALQGVRLVEPTLGEVVVVTGLGLIGLITVQLLRAQGCRVLGLDPDPARRALAQRFGAEVVDLGAGQDPLAAAQAVSRGRGVDAVIITAATRSNRPIQEAARMCRKRGRIVLVGVTGLELSRADFYEKELRFQVSCSYGPGRYDPSYESGGQDYPLGFVRWTAQRNFEAVLDLLADGQLDVGPLISHRFALDAIERAYAVVAGAEPSLGIVLEYPLTDAVALRQRTLAVAGDHAPRAIPGRAGAAATGSGPVLTVIGAGAYAAGVLIPAFKAAGVVLHGVVSQNGVSASHAARRYGFALSSTDAEALLADPRTEAVVVATRHDSHAALVCAALAVGKPVFVEKPLCLTLDELAAIEAQAGDGACLMVGFNRRFSPFIVRAKALIGETPAPMALVMSVNAGALPANHWTQERTRGGGRLIGEACHFIDLLRHLVGAPIVGHSVRGLGGRSSSPRESFSVSLSFADGSLGTVHYFANGSKAFPKERLEVFCAGRVLQVDNFRRLRGYGWPGFRGLRTWRQNKGQQACAAAFVEAVRAGQAAPIPLPELLEVARVSIELARELEEA